MMKRRPGWMGASSILMIFVVLALTTFGMLSLLSSRADLRLTQKAAAHTAAYYEAEDTVEKTLAAIDDLLVTARRETAALSRTGRLQTPGLTPPDAAQGPEAVYLALIRAAPPVPGNGGPCRWTADLLRPGRRPAGDRHRTRNPAADRTPAHQTSAPRTVRHK